MSHYKTFSLLSEKNYKDIFDNFDLNQYFKLYNELIQNYLNYLSDNIFLHDNNIFLFIILKGIDTIHTIFNFLLLYTKNLDLAYYHCEKSFCYYIEFINQIQDDKDLELTTKDAILFIYKKTIFNILQVHRKNFKFNNEKEKKLIQYFFDLSNSYNNIYKNYFTLYQETNICLKKEIIKETYKKINNCINEILKNNKLLKNKSNIKVLFDNTYTLLDITNIFLEKFSKSIIKTQNIDKVLKVLYCLIKKVTRNTAEKKKDIIQKIKNKNIDVFLQRNERKNYTELKMVNYIIE